MSDLHDDFGLDELRAMSRAGSEAAIGRPPAQIRGLGARRHRMRVAGIGIVSIVAVAAVGGGAVAVVGNVTGTQLESAAPLVPGTEAVTPRPTDPHTAEPTALPTEPADPPSTVPAGPPPTEIPRDFPIDRDLPADNGADEVLEGPAFGESWATTAMPAPCGARDFLGDPVETLSVSFTAPELGLVRDVRMHRDAEEAAEVIQGYADALAACPEERSDDGEWLVVYEAHPQSLGDGSLLVSRHVQMAGYPASPGMDQYIVAQVGPAVLVVGSYGEATPGTEAAHDQREAVIETAEALVDELAGR